MKSLSSFVYDVLGRKRSIKHAEQWHHEFPFIQKCNELSGCDRNCVELCLYHSGN